MYAPSNSHLPCRNPNILWTFGAALLTLMLMTGTAHADVTAVFEAGSERMTIEYRDDNHIRMQAADGNFILVNAGKAYIVAREDGKWQVLALDDLAAMAGAAGLSGTSTRADRGEATLRDTGRNETVAGIRGRVHQVVMSDGWSEDVVGEVVLSDDANARAAFRGMVRLTTLMGQMAQQHGMGDFDQGLPALGNRAILRADNDWRLASVKRGSIPDRHFTLPAEPTRLGQTGAQPRQRLPPGADRQHQPIRHQRPAALHQLPDRIVGPVQRHRVHHQIMRSGFKRESFGIAEDP